MDDVIAPEGLPPPTPTQGSSPDLPGPAVRYETRQLMQRIAKLYEGLNEIATPDAQALRRIATALATSAGADPEAIVVVPGAIPRAPKGAMLIEGYLLRAQPYWTCFLPEARAALDAMKGTAE